MLVVHSRVLCAWHVMHNGLYGKFYVTMCSCNGRCKFMQLQLTVTHISDNAFFCFLLTTLFRFGYCWEEQYVTPTVGASIALCVNAICPINVPRKLFRISENWCKARQVHISSLICVSTVHATLTPWKLMLNSIGSLCTCCTYVMCSNQFACKPFCWCRKTMLFLHWQCSVFNGTDMANEHSIWYQHVKLCWLWLASREVFISGDHLQTYNASTFMCCNLEMAGVGNKQKQGWEKSGNG